MNQCQLAGQNVFTLVSYTPEPLLLSFRQLLPVKTECEPHITILPPRPLTIPVHEAQQRITSQLANWNAFEIELGGVRVFPGTHVLYLEVNEGAETLRRLHADLNTGDFAHQEAFTFHPHITLGASIYPDRLEAISRKAEKDWNASVCPRRFKIEEVAFVWIPAHGKPGEWSRSWRYKLGTAKSYRQAAGAAVTSQIS